MEMTEARAPAKRPATKPKLRHRPTTPLHVYVAGGADGRETGLDNDFGDGGVSVPVRHPFFELQDDAVVQVAVGQRHTAALTRDGAVLTWGCNDFYALGRETPSEDYERQPAAVQALLNLNLDIVQVAVTDHATFALTSNGRVWGWGIFMVRKIDVVLLGGYTPRGLPPEETARDSP